MSQMLRATRFVGAARLRRPGGKSVVARGGGDGEGVCKKELENIVVQRQVLSSLAVNLLDLKIQQEGKLRSFLY